MIRAFEVRNWRLVPRYRGRCGFWGGATWRTCWNLHEQFLTLHCGYSCNHSEKQQPEHELRHIQYVYCTFLHNWHTLVKTGKRLKGAQKPTSQSRGHTHTPAALWHESSISMDECYGTGTNHLPAGPLISSVERVIVLAFNKCEFLAMEGGPEKWPSSVESSANGPNVSLWFCSLLRHSARKRDRLILRLTTDNKTQHNTAYSYIPVHLATELACYVVCSIRLRPHSVYFWHFFLCTAVITQLEEAAVLVSFGD